MQIISSLIASSLTGSIAVGERAADHVLRLVDDASVVSELERAADHSGKNHKGKVP